MATSKRPFSADTTSDGQYAGKKRSSALVAEVPHRSDTSTASEAASELLSSVDGVDARDLTPATEQFDTNDESSEVSTSSEEVSSDSDEDSDVEADEVSQQGDAGNVEASEEPITVRGATKPSMKLSKVDRELGTSLRSRLKAFLPKMAEANRELEAERAAGTLEQRNIENMEDDEDDQYIEMNLGLGVLEEKDPNASNLSSDSESDDEGGSEGKRERDIMGKLMGQQRHGAGIQIVEDATKDSP